MKKIVIMKKELAQLDRIAAVAQWWDVIAT